MLTKCEIDAYCHALLSILRSTGMSPEDGIEIMGNLFVGAASIDAVRNGSTRKGSLELVKQSVDAIFASRYDEVAGVVAADEAAHRDESVQ